MTRATLALLAIGAAWLLLRRRRKPASRYPYVVGDQGPETFVPMAAWDGAAAYDGNSRTIRVRWTPTTTEV